MSWLISSALMAAYGNSRSSSGREAASSEGSCSDGGPCAPSRSNRTPLAYCAPGRTTAFSRRSLSGTTFGRLTESLGAGLLTWYLAGFPARKSALLARVRGSVVNGQGSGWNLPASFVKYDPTTCGWRTRQLSLFGGLEKFSETWPRWGSMRGGECSPLPTLEHDTSESGFGYWPTPCATDDQHFCHVTMRRKEAGEDRPSGAKIGSCLKWERRALPYVVNRKIHPILHDWLLLWPYRWTDLEPLGMDRFQRWLDLHGRS